MKKIFLLLAIILLTGKIYAQVPAAAGREISGIVKDTTDSPVIGAIVVLKYGTDSVRLSTTPSGVFVFKNVKAGEFLISVRSIGFANFNKKFLFNEGSNRLVLDPIIMKESSNMLGNVVINGTPAIVYKEDTVEYRASDYVVKPNATVDELLKKMEGVEVGADGTVTHQGIEVQRLRLNGKDYAGGDVASAIQDLPADIIEKAQFVDDFGNEAARTGIKDGEPTKILNLTTRRDRSVGNRGRLNAGLGNNDRYGTTLSGSRINGNQQMNVNLNFNNTVTGVAGGGGGDQGGGGRQGGGGQGGGGRQGGGGGGGFTGGGGGGGSGGINQTGGGNIGFRDQFGPKIGVNTSYSYRFQDNNSTNNSVSERYSTLGTTYLTTDNKTDQGSRTNNFSFDVEYEIDSTNFLRFSPSLSFITENNNAFTNEAKKGVQYRTDIGNRNTDTKRPTLKGNIVYDHEFQKSGRLATVNLDYSTNDRVNGNDVNTRILFYDAETDLQIRDSLVQRLVSSKNLQDEYGASFTYREPLVLKPGTNSYLSFNLRTNRRHYDNTTFTDNVNNGGAPSRIDSLSRIFNYNFTTTRIGLLYGLTKNKFNSSLGLTLVPSVLEGVKEHISASLKRTNLTLIPIANVRYQFSRQHSLSLRYNGSPQEPTFDQIVPVRDESDPNNPIVGNPDLRVAFRHSAILSYQNYIVNKSLNLYTNITGTTNPNQVARNVVEYFDTDSILIRETRYVNLNGANGISGNYGISKSFAKRKYKLDLTGSIAYNRSISMSNNLLNLGDTWRFNERLVLQVNPTEWLELNPNASYSTQRGNYSLPSSRDNLTRTFAVSGDGRIYIMKRNVLNFSARKNFVSGINANVTNNPLVINTTIERQFFKRNNGALGIQAYDLLNQNNFVNRNISENGFTDIKSNSLSRYFMINFRWTPQKWTGAPQRGGRELNRRGDGSFIE